ncbi:hypothetical protein [Gordonia sp. (in: high G+C Gram-positive bacteria)]|uniref:hypothetical protein n=1 Tax=Gordonia sp. (in: high G+C Gram-positive bacteria) TaxID=84139 RepID=UPI003C753275
MSSTQRDAKVIPLFIGYVLMLAQFILLCLFLMSLAFDMSTSMKVGTAIAWAVLLVASLIAMANQATVNRRLEAKGAYPSPHLLVPTERPARVSEYMNLYRNDNPARELIDK